MSGDAQPDEMAQYQSMVGKDEVDTLVVLEANPAENTANTCRINEVVLNDSNLIK